MKKLFSTWLFKGVRFIAVDNGQTTHIVDESGNNYGSWLYGEEAFRMRQQKGDELAAPIGRAVVTIHAAD